MRPNIVAFDDRALIDWLLKLVQERSPHFLSFLAEAAMLADAEEYAIIRPGLLLLKRKESTEPMT